MMYEFFLNQLIIASGTFFWLQYLTYEMTYYHRDSDYVPKWYEREL